ncbi:MAG: lysozyme [Streptosporangiales bacterium]
MTMRPRFARACLAFAAVPAVAAAAVLVAGPAAADSTEPAQTSRIGHPERDYMGSTIPGHQKRAAAPERRAPDTSRASGVRGLDVSHWQGKINWKGVYADGARFAYMKATEGTSYQDPSFDRNYPNSYYAGLVRGAYHFALPNKSSGAAQANYFADHGGGWSGDGKTLPGVLDIEYNPYGGTCYGKSDAGMRNWIADFINRYHKRTGRWAVIYTTTDWWKTCTGNYGGFADHSPLWLARYASSPGALPNGWSFYTFWQYNDHGTYPGDQNVFNGSYKRLKVLATG